MRLGRSWSICLENESSKKYEIVDDQQRLTALRDFSEDLISLLGVDEKSKLRVPRSVRAVDAPWAGNSYSNLPMELQDQFDNTKITTFQIGPDALRDEIRDLFIRLQSGTALSRQQIRDAWPGQLGPFIERLAGKLKKRPGQRLFSVVDKRGQRDDEDQKDAYVTDRQTCAQLLKIFMARERDPQAYPSVSANELDAMYHEFTDFAPNGGSALRFTQVLEMAAKVFDRANQSSPRGDKFRRMDVTAVTMFLQDLSKDQYFKLDSKSVDELANKIVASKELKKPTGKTTSGSSLKEYYNWWRDNVANTIGIRLDSRRIFDDKQKQQIREKHNSICAICGQYVSEDDEEFDHFPLPYRDGGRTEVENGRLVHRTCHERGRPVESD